MAIAFIIPVCRSISILLMYLGLFNGSICTTFILREFYLHSQLRTSLNFLIVTIFTTDCLRALICAPFESYVLIKTWDVAIRNCQEEVNLNESYLTVFNFCRLTMAVRFCFNVVQPFSFVAMAYERLRTIVKRNGNLNLNHIHNQQRDLHRLKYAIIWISISLLLGITAGLYQGMTYTLSRTCYEDSSISSRFILIIRLCCILSAAFLSGSIYAKIFFMIKKYQRNSITPIISIYNNNTTNPIQISIEKSQLIDLHKKDFRMVKNTFIIFLSFFLCRIPSVIIIFVTLFLNQQSNNSQCFLEEFTNLSIQLTFIATFTDPVSYIYHQPILKQKFFRFLNFCFPNRIQQATEH